MSPDMASSLFPDRPIRPLPKRRLRERLTPEAAESIRYPPSTFSSVPLFQYPPYSARDEAATPRAAGPASNSTVPDQGRQSTRNYTINAATGTAASGPRTALVRREHPEILNTSAAAAAAGRPAAAARPDQRQQSLRLSDPPPPPSAASSVDGYDSFENTNNKKKRKIPSAGDSTLNGTHGSSLGSDVSSPQGGGGVATTTAAAAAAAAATAAAAAEVNGDRAGGVGYAGSGSFGANNSSPGMSGSGRGRLVGRSRNGRSPLRALSDGNNTWAGRPPKGPAPHWASSADYEGGSGIISTAIAKAERLAPRQGQENVSLLEQHSAVAKTAPASTQFTFTCESQVPGSLQWPASGKTARAGMASEKSAAGVSGSSGSGGPPDDPSKGSGGRGGGSSRRKKGRALSKELKAAAEQREQATREQNAHNPPKESERWMCEFCEYKAIFGKEPEALIRKYEKKDLRARQEEADRKRLLEKAKAKGRKAKRSGSAATKGGSAGNQAGGTQTAGTEAEQWNDGGLFHETAEAVYVQEEPGAASDGGGASRRGKLKDQLSHDSGTIPPG
ncbi:hypothetical protein GMORB2_5354 [Geosmithia morbida]|uniref:Uncharacterized protein n=1 Tax=Geosmithia morbida TaxID=1094350 RepID=A0A9P4YX38_9HYPO|nr:uncharacterized protein GMORB2_5354 [Geosmithia morbida]KAF4124688.1 hypothetical protein GMORB2_5354 [Geosmithia morbida]